MKTITLFGMLLFGLIFNCSVFGQKRTRYVVLDTLSEKQMKLNHIKCTDGTYKAELFNIFKKESPDFFILLTALPNYDSKKPEWKAIGLDSVRQATLTLDSLGMKLSDALSQFYNSQGNNGGYMLKNDYVKPIIKIGGIYYTPASQTLLEYFVLIRPNSASEYLYNVFPNLNQFFEINITAPIFPLKKFEGIYLQKFKHPSFNSAYTYGFDRFNTHNVYNKPILIRDNDAMIAGKKGYKFWTLASLGTHGVDPQRGIDRFMYVPEYGIVSGSYSYYFWNQHEGKLARSLSEARERELLKNYLEDKQMMPYEINGKRILNPKK